MIRSVWKQLAVAVCAALLVGDAAYGQRRVFTNEDIATTPPPAAAPAEAETSAAAPESQPAAAAASEEDRPPTPQEEARRLAAIVDALGQAEELLWMKLREGAPNADTEALWNQMRDSLGVLLTEFRRFADEARAAAEQAAAAPAEAAAAPAANPAP